jgi:hypothetical protein|tara:strand:+ start:250 stop:579 length:330 start_codon:yes stop_codon:yes gene_type:complete
VDAKFREGFSHPHAMRRFYFDEDSWQILATDLRNNRGELVDLEESHPISYYEVPVFSSTLETIYNFKKKYYFVDRLDNNEAMYGFNAKLSKSDLSASALQRYANEEYKH